MASKICLALGVAGIAEASQYQRAYGPRLGKRMALNETVSTFTNTSTSTTTIAITPTSIDTSAWSTISSFNPPIIPSSATTRSKPSSQLWNNSTIDVPGCAGLVTYWGSVPPTTYITVTEGFEVTIPSSNATVSASETLLTPPTACESMIMPLLSSFQPLMTIDITSQLPLKSASPEIAATSKECCGPPKAPLPAAPLESDAAHTEEAPPPSFTVMKSTVYATAPYTSTVIVTKKTPVVVVQTPTSPPPVFQEPDPNGNNNSGGSDDPGPNAPSNDRPGGPSPGPDSPSDNDSTSAPSPSGPSPGPGIVVPGPGPTSTAPIGDVIISLIRTQPFIPPTPTPHATVGNVPVVVLPSSIVLGSSAINVPAASETIATIDGQPFTIRPSEVVADGSTFAIPIAADLATPAPAVRITVAPGVIAEVADSTAVIAGTTYRIGPGADSTRITVGGVPVILGPDGVELPSTTVAANAITESPMIVESADGLTFSFDQSEVIVDGTTFRIGDGAPTIITEIDGQPVSIGPDGVGLRSTTLQPTSVRTSTSGSGTETETSTADGSAVTEVDSDGAGSRVERNPMREVVSWGMVMFMGLLV